MTRKTRFTHKECSTISDNLIQNIQLSAISRGYAADLQDKDSLMPFTLGYLSSFLSSLMRDNPELVADVQGRIELLQRKV